MIELELPYPPTVNHFKQVGRTIKTKRGKIYQQRFDSDQTKRFYYEVWAKVRSQIGQKSNPMGLDATISCEVCIDLYPPDKRLRDVDNVIKPTLDALQKAGVLVNDNQICRLLVERKSIIPHGQIIVRITPYEPK